MIVIVGRAQDGSAQSLVRRWEIHDAALLTPRDLSRPGWLHRPEAPLAGRAVVSGRSVSVREISSVVTTLETVTTYDVPHIVPDDRAYVAAEMRAFLFAWLEAIPCRMLNRPTLRSLAGSGWRPEQWALAAAALGIPTAPVVGAPAEEADEPPATVAVTQVADETLDAPSPLVAGWVRRLASVSGAGTLVARFLDGPRPRLVAVSVVPDFARRDVAMAAMRWLETVRR